MQAKKWANEYRTTIVCVDGYENRIPVGRFYNPLYAEGVRFHGVVDLIRKLENMLDQMQFPQSFSLVRRFSDVRTASAAGGSTEMKPHNGDVATFAVRVLFRQNASWQGSILWVEGDREESFRSVLELIFLLDSAAGAEGGAL